MPKLQKGPAHTRSALLQETTMSIRLHFGDVLVRKWHDGTGGLDGNELLQRRPDDIRLHLHVMGFPRIGAHRHQRGYRPGCARLPHNGRHPRF